jgi:murein DD-endopeptidase MepM/ murein hydrolase activator NlpD
MAKVTVLSAAMVAGLLASGCAYVEWPPRNGQPAPVAQPVESSPMFVGAEAVVVGRGDTLYGLANRHGVSARAIIDANGLKPPYKLLIGQRLVLPRDREHQVQRGEGLYAIARLYNADPHEMARLNGLSAPYRLLIGQRLRIPGSATAAASPAPPPEAQPVGKVEGVALEPPKGGVDVVSLPTPGESLPPPSQPDESAPRSQPEAAVRAPLPEPPAATGKGLAWPVRGKVVSGFGPKEKGLQNDGINIVAPSGTPIVAAESGIVAYAGNELRGFGNLVLIKHADGMTTAYAHADEILVKRGDTVAKGQTIAKVGQTGSVHSPQLHFEVRRGKQPVDPMIYLSGSAGA